jgi:hypothetical protein
MGAAGRRAGPKVLLWTFGSVALFLAASASVAWLRWNAAPWRRLEEVRSLARERGLPVTGSELAGEPLPEAEKAAKLYEAAFELYQETAARIRASVWAEEDGDGQKAEAGEDGPAGESRAPVDPELEVTARLARDEPLIEALRRAASSGECRFPIDHDGVGTSLPHLVYLQAATRIFRDRALEHAREGNLDAAFDDLRVAGSLNRALAHEPYYISQNYRLRHHEHLLAALESLLPLADDPLERLDFIALPATGGSAGVALRGEVVAILDLAADLSSDLLEAFHYPRFAIPLIAPYMRSDLAAHVERIVRFLDAEAQPYPEWLELGEELAREAAAGGRFSRLWQFVCLRVIQAEARCASRTAMARLAARLLSHRRMTGAFPETLEMPGLLAGEAIDPYTGKPFRLLRRGEALWIASEAVPLGSEGEIGWLLDNDPEGYIWARWRVDAPLPPRRRE